MKEKSEKQKIAQEITKEEAKYLLEIARDIVSNNCENSVYGTIAEVQKGYKHLLAGEDMTTYIKSWHTANKAKNIVKKLKELEGNETEKAQELSVLFDDLGIDV